MHENSKGLVEFQYIIKIIFTRPKGLFFSTSLTQLDSQAWTRQLNKEREMS